jgi:hypothetical protein
MFGHVFYHNTIRKYVILFGTLFNDIYINRSIPNSDEIVTTKIPISYGPKEKTLSRVLGDPELNRDVAISLPRMSFELLSLNYAPTRKLVTTNRNVNIDVDSNKLLYQYNPVPYDLIFELDIMVKNADDGTRIIEQILPFFTPEWNTTINLIPEMDLLFDIPVILNSVDSTDTYEGDYQTRRALIWTLTFTLKGYIFGPIKRQEVIKEAITNALAASGDLDFETFIFGDTVNSTEISTEVEGAEPSALVSIQPGLTSNGTPTSNSTLSIDPDLIPANSEYGYIITKQQ